MNVHGPILLFQKKGGSNTELKDTCRGIPSLVYNNWNSYLAIHSTHTISFQFITRRYNFSSIEFFYDSLPSRSSDKSLLTNSQQSFSYLPKFSSKITLQQSKICHTTVVNCQTEWIGLFPPDVNSSIPGQIYSSSLPVGLLIKSCSTILISSRPNLFLASACRIIY